MVDYYSNRRTIFCQFLNLTRVKFLFKFFLVYLISRKIYLSQTKHDMIFPVQMALFCHLARKIIADKSGLEGKNKTESGVINTVFSCNCKWKTSLLVVGTKVE